MSSEINCIALIGKQYFSPNLKYHYIAHTFIDVIEERVSNGPKNLDLYLGLLYAMEDLAVYGYITNTRVKIIAVASVTDGIIRDADMKSLFRKIHQAYVTNVCNPFYNIDSQKSITSKVFSQTIESIGSSARTLDI
ncbi:unnamed protein product [Rhizopus stolonifer]